MQQLEGDAPIELRIVGRVDPTPATSAHQREHQVAADRVAAAASGAIVEKKLGRQTRLAPEEPFERPQVGVRGAPKAASESARMATLIELAAK